MFDVAKTPHYKRGRTFLYSNTSIETLSTALCFHKLFIPQNGVRGIFFKRNVDSCFPSVYL